MSSASVPTGFSAQLAARRFVRRSRPSESGRIALLVSAMVVLSLVGLLFAEGLTSYGQQVILAASLSWLLTWIFRNSGSAYTASALLAARIATVVVATLYIEPYYLSTTGLDADLYHSVGIQISQTLRGSGTLPVTGLNFGTNCYAIYTGFCYLLFGTNPLAIKLLNTGIAAVGSIFFYKAYVLYYARTSRTLQLLLFFSPTLLYWSSIHGKDPLAFFSLGMGFWGTARFAKEGSKQGLLVGFFAAVCLFLIRPHIACVYLGALSVVLLVRNLSAKRSTATRLASVSCLILVALVGHFAVLDYLQDRDSSPDAILEYVSTQHNALDSGNAALEVPSLVGWKAAMAYLPYGAASVMFRPFPWENGGLFFRLTSIEQLILTAAELIIIGHFFLSGLNGSLHGIRPVLSRASTDALAIFAVTYAIGFVLLFTYIAGNLGTLAREKIQLAPFVWCGAFAVASRYQVRRS